MSLNESIVEDPALSTKTKLNFRPPGI